MPRVRAPAVAGRFYPGDAKRLEKDVRGYLATDQAPAKAIGVVAPHAGYMYSGAIAGAGYARVQVPRSAIVLCPNHTGMGVRRAISTADAWRLPVGDLALDSELTGELVERAGLEPDEMAHQHEHAAEVQLPFLWARNPEVRIAVACLSGLSARECVQIGEGIAQAIGGRKDVLLVASTDMSHYVAATEAKRLDAMALARVQALDAEGLCRVVEENDISMCGYIPTAVVLAAAKKLGARSAALARYGNSGEASGDFDQVVGYASLVIS
jgi:MEMO1 family protein